MSEATDHDGIEFQYLNEIERQKQVVHTNQPTCRLYYCKPVQLQLGPNKQLKLDIVI